MFAWTITESLLSLRLEKFKTESLHEGTAVMSSGEYSPNYIRMTLYISIYYYLQLDGKSDVMVWNKFRYMRWWPTHLLFNSLLYIFSSSPSGPSPSSVLFLSDQREWPGYFLPVLGFHLSKYCLPASAKFCSVSICTIQNPPKGQKVIHEDSTPLIVICEHPNTANNVPYRIWDCY